MVGNDIRLTRCTTCETEHPYKGGKAPRLRKKKTSVEAAYDEVLESVKQDAPAPGLAVTPSGAELPDGASGEEDGAEAPAHGNNGDRRVPAEEVRLHRQLIRAQLPRIEREPVARPAPEFTIRQANKRHGRFQHNSRPARFATNDSHGNTRGSGGPQGGGRQGGRPHGHGSPTRPGGGRHQHSGPKKRSR